MNDKHIRQVSYLVTVDECVNWKLSWWRRIKLKWMIWRMKRKKQLVIGSVKE